MAREELKHWITVAWNSGYPWSRAFWLGLLHDVVEDGYLPTWLLRYWPAWDAITRRDGETYREYIQRVKANPLARKIKIMDLTHNLERNNGKYPSLITRHLCARSELEHE